MALQETYGNWLGPERLRRQPGIYSVASKMSPVGDFRPASPDSFEDDYDDVSMAGSERSPPAKGVYLLAGPPGSSQDPSPENLELKSSNPDPKSPNPDPKSQNPNPKSRDCRTFWNSVAVLALLVASSALLWGGLLAAALGKQPRPQIPGLPHFLEFRGRPGALGGLQRSALGGAPGGGAGQTTPPPNPGIAALSGIPWPSWRSWWPRALCSGGGSWRRRWANDPAPKSRDCRTFWNSVAVLALLVASSALLWGGLLAAALGKHTELRAELEQLRSNLSEIWDLVQQEQTRLQFGIHQHQQELQELSEVLCGAVGSSRRCGAGWQSHARSCFSFSQRSLSWGAARNACADLGAHLAVVNDEAEQEFLLQHTQRGFSYWLGLSRAEQGSAWSWLNNQEPNFTFWDIWLQDPQKELKKCGSIGREGRWVKEKCTRPHRWICEKAAKC